MKTLYHGTSSKNVDGIKAEGLIPGKARGGDAWAARHMPLVAAESKKRDPSVYVTDEIDIAMQFTFYAVSEVGGMPAVIKADVPDSLFATFVTDEMWNDSSAHVWRAPKLDHEYVTDAITGRKLASTLVDSIGRL